MDGLGSGHFPVRLSVSANQNHLCVRNSKLYAARGPESLSLQFPKPLKDDLKLRDDWHAEHSFAVGDASRANTVTKYLRPVFRVR